MTARWRRRNRPGLLARWYDWLTAPLERTMLGRWRSAFWRELRADLARHQPTASPAIPVAATRSLGLEVGVGTGANFTHYPRDACVIATDVSSTMLGIAQRKLALPSSETRGAEVFLVAADAGHLPFRDATFAWAAETLVFCEVPDPIAASADVGRVLVPGGLFLMLEHVRPGGWHGWLASLLTRLTGPLWSEHFDRDPAQSVRMAGLEICWQRWLWRDIVTLLAVRTSCRPSGA